MRRTESRDIHGRVGEVAWYSGSGCELVRLDLFYAGGMGARLIVTHATCSSAADIAELREALNSACDVAEQHLADLAKERAA